MAITKQKLIDDIILRVTKGAPSDDLELEPRQIAFWFDLIAKTAVPEYLNRALSKKESIDPIYILIEDDKSATVEDVTMLADYEDRTYITVTKVPMSLRNDSGIVRIITEEGAVVNNVTIEQLDTINNLTFSKPTRDNLLYSRINQKIYIHGLSPRQVNIVKFSVYYIPTIDISSLTDSDEVRISDELLSLISEAVEGMALKELFSVDPDVENDQEDDNNRPKR